MAKKDNEQKSAEVKKTRHKEQPFTVLYNERVDSRSAQRYTSPYHAAVGIVRHYREWLTGDLLRRDVRIELPNKQYRFGWITAGKVVLGPIQAIATKRARK